ncbi:MAG: hypothetical protein ACHQIM_02555 [Sphingobacteriales bacterium]
MNELEDFHLTLYHAKLRLLPDVPGSSINLWDRSIQRDIDALYHLNPEKEIQAYYLAARDYFGKRVPHEGIIASLKSCLKENLSKEGFTFVFYNRLNALVKKCTPG